MTKDAKELLEKAKALPPADRAAMAQQLLLTLEHDLDRDVDSAWQEEVNRRCREVDEGSVQPVTWESVRDRLRNRKRATS